MNRRRGPTGASADDRVSRRDGPARPPGSRRAGGGGGRRDQNNPPTTATSRIGVRALLLLLFGSLVAVEYAAYKTLGAGPAPPPQVDAGGARHLTPAASKNNNHVPSDPRGQANPRNATTAAAPTRRPSAALADSEKLSTYSPTAQRKGWRVKSARRASRSNSAWWKTRTPDPLPPLPPDVDPETGEALPPVIAYVTTLTKCGPKHRGGLDGAAVLLHSIRRNSFGWTPEKVEEIEAGEEAFNGRPRHGGRGGRYRHRAYVIVDPAASPDNPNKSGECARFLRRVGYRGGYVASRRPETGPTARRPGEGPDHLRLMMSDDGCCGYTELLKLHVYGMVGHPLAVHLDFDSLLLRPMDDLFDAMLGTAGSPDEAREKVRLASLPKSKSVDFSVPIGAAFTRDYNSVVRPSPTAPVGYQGGFLVVRPDPSVLDDYRDILLRGEFMLGPRKGWESAHGGFYGDVTFQGILPYYYETYAPGRGAERRRAEVSGGDEKAAIRHNEAELDRCVYNQMADNPRKSTYKFPRATPLDPDAMGFRDTDTCRDGRRDCSDTDCQRVDPGQTVSAHFTFCGKPWDCSEGNPGTVASETCRSLLGEWYAVRRELEDWWTSVGSGAGWDGDGGDGGASYREAVTRGRVAESRRGGLGGGDGGVARLGYCDSVGTDGYRRLVEPDGPVS
ncbi:hypothetical protein THAOC_10480 [Thalassiosira oceanica]|uniref:Nucleotide-diphospho-sugar transferase domain-containing protein n=1 Tax=Thalassiosira oceanica TaxID=159749 RepID=K0TCX5_THAOC|nr:hypothetical protein THAOC_10480 [Thalassiosira oceanica]|eukprot:EJK68347.1 hypothetical protein THAOC_10480 [Thalassiosira oceanica]